jgi:ESS family glutamate:Na+ symporter
VQLILRATGAHEYVDRSTVNRISGVATDFLIVAGMESIKFSVVVKYAVPLTILFVFGFLLNWFWFMRFGMNMARENSFERNIFVWGAANGVVTTGILLLRVVDPEFKSRTLEDAAMALVANRPIVIALTAFPPIMICSGMAGLFTWICIGGFIVLLLAARIFKWWNPGASPIHKQG